MQYSVVREVIGERMAFSIAGNYQQRTNERQHTRSGCQCRSEFSRLSSSGTHLSWFHGVLLFLVIYISMSGTCIVSGTPLRTPLTTHTDVQYRRALPESSFNQMSFKSFVESVLRRVNEPITTPEAASENSVAEVQFGALSVSRTTERTQEERRKEEGNDSNIQQVLGQYLSDPLGDGRSLRSNGLFRGRNRRTSRYPSQPETVQLITKSGYFLHVAPPNVHSKTAMDSGTCLSIESPAGYGGPTLVRIRDPATNTYISMDDAGVLHAVSLTQEDLHDREGPTIWRQTLLSANRYYGYYQVKDNDVRWYLHLGNSNVQQLSAVSDDVKFRQLDCD